MTDVLEVYDINSNVVQKIGDEKSRTNTAAEFSTSQNYAIGDYCLYDGVLYRFTSAHNAGTWNSSHVIQVNITNELKEAKILIAEFASLSATTGTLISISDSRIKSYTKPLPFLSLSNPELQTNNWTITTNTGIVTISGNASGTGTSGKIFMVNPQ